MEDSGMPYIIRKLVICSLALLLSSAEKARANPIGDPSYRIRVIDIDRVINKNWLGIPRTVDCMLRWEVYENMDGSWIQIQSNPFNSYQAICMREDGSQPQQSPGTTEENVFTFSGLEVGTPYRFFVMGRQEGQEHVLSDTARVLTGRTRRPPRPMSLHWLPLSGRTPLALFGRGEIFDDSTRAGKIAFHLIWNFWLIGGIIWLFFCVRILSLRRIFPMKGVFVIGHSYDGVFKRGISKKFTDVIDAWRKLVEKSNTHMRKSVEGGTHANVEEIETVNVKFWKEEGAKKIRKLLDQTADPKLLRYPVVRIIRAGLENHELGGYRWLEVSKEVDRAIENRASSELECLRRKSFLDWLWNLGTLAPLIGLFGTATGISNAFVGLMMIQTSISQTQLVKRLAVGIFEALWTTIEGLFVGILLMLLYYFYQNKLNWIYSKWEEIYVQISEKL